MGFVMIGFGRGYFASTQSRRLRVFHASEMKNDALVFIAGINGSKMMNAIKSMLLLGVGIMQAGLAQAPVRPYVVQVAKIGDSSPFDMGSPEFDARGNAYLRSGKDFSVIEPGGAVRKFDFDAVATAAINRDIFAGKGTWDDKWDQTSIVDNGVTVDNSDRIYTLVVPRYSNLKTAVLMWSDDGAQNWHAFALTGRNAMIERRDGFNDMSGPPSVISFDYYGAYNGPHLWLEPLRFTDGQLTRAGTAMLVSGQSLLYAKHSGCANSTFTTVDHIYVVYPIVGPAGSGTAEMARQFNRKTGQFEGGETPIGRSLTVKGPDPHDTPGITADSHGTLSIVLPGHQVLLQMIRSRVPGTLLSGFTSPEQVGQPRNGNKDGFYTYPSLTTSPDGTVNIVARAEGTGYLFRLVQLQKRPGQAWTVWPGGTVDRTIALPLRQSYIAWRQAVSMDRRGRLFLNFRYFADQLTPQERTAAGLDQVAPSGPCQGNGRCFFINAPTVAPLTLVSTDSGTTWQPSGRR